MRDQWRAENIDVRQGRARSRCNTHAPDWYTTLSPHSECVTNSGVGDWCGHAQYDGARDRLRKLST